MSDYKGDRLSRSLWTVYNNKLTLGYDQIIETCLIGTLNGMQALLLTHTISLVSRSFRPYQPVLILVPTSDKNTHCT